MFKTKHKYEVTLADGHVCFVEGYDIVVWDDDNDQSKGDICIEGRRSGNDVAWFRKENVRRIVKVA